MGKAKEKKRSTVSQLLDYAGSYKSLTIAGCILSAVAMLAGMIPYICVWLVAKDLIEVAPDWSRAEAIQTYGWIAFVAAFGGILIYFIALMCTHLAAFRTAENIRKRGMKRLMYAPLGYFDNNPSGLVRNRLDGGAAETETLLAHNLADITGTIAMFVGMLVLMFAFDWRMGAACLISAVISIVAMFSMMGGEKAKVFADYQMALDKLSKAGTEYVRGIPVVKVFQQTVYAFRSFKEAIDEYSDKAEYYQGDMCRMPQTVNLTFTEGAFVFLVPLTIFLAPRAVADGNFVEFVADFAFYAVFSAIISTALAKVMFATSGLMMAQTALDRIRPVTEAPQLTVTDDPKMPEDNRIEFKGVTFIYEGSETPALEHVSFTAESGETVALVGPSGGGKTTAASLIPRFWDATEGAVLIGGVDVKDMDHHVLMDQVAFVFQDSRLFKKTIYENVKASRPGASEEDVAAALDAAQCKDIIDKFPDGMDTVIGSKGTYLSGGETQRIAIARAILKDSPIVVLDEATAFADPENEVLIQKALAKLTENKTVVIIAHRLSTITGADRIIVLDRGRVAESGTHDELVGSNGLYARMWEDYNRSVLWKISTDGEVDRHVR